MKSKITHKMAQQRIATLKKEIEKLSKIADNSKTDLKDWKDVTNFELACKWLNKNAKTLLKKWEAAGLTESQIGYLQYETCIEAINTENGVKWIPNWFDNNEYKYRIYSYTSGGQWAVVGGFAWDYLHAPAGLHSQSYEKAQHGIKYFIEYYEKMNGIKN